MKMKHRSSVNSSCTNTITQPTHMKEVWFLRGQVIIAATSGAAMEVDTTHLRLFNTSK